MEKLFAGRPAQGPLVNGLSTVEAVLKEANLLKPASLSHITRPSRW
jgi:hypothetical protein